MGNLPDPGPGLFFEELEEEEKTTSSSEEVRVPPRPLDVLGPRAGLPVVFGKSKANDKSSHVCLSKDELKSCNEPDC
jgi:hypothetical protein